MNTKEKVSASGVSIEQSEQRNIIGCKAFSGGSVTEIANSYRINREFVYTQKERVKRLIESDETSLTAPVVSLDRQMIEKIIIGCMLFCKGSTEDTQRFLDSIFDVWVSIGKISTIIIDVFHTEYDISKAVLASERSAYKNILEEEKILKKVIKKDTPDFFLHDFVLD